MSIARSRSKPAWRWGLALAALCLLVRFPLWWGYAPVAGEDTATYVSMAAQIASADLRDYVGKRPPGYPVFLLMLGMNYQLVWVVQSVLGITTSLLIFGLARRRGVGAGAAFSAGAAVSMSVNLLLFEAGILTETLSTFLLVLAFWLWDRGVHAQDARAQTRDFFGVSVLVGTAALVKPFLLFLVALLPLLTVFARWRTGGTWRQSAIAAAVVLLPALVFVLAWSAFNKSRLDYFGVTTLAGYNLTQHSGAIMEDAPDQYATIRDIYLKHREPRKQAKGSHSMTIWEAYPEMMQVTGQTFPELSKTLGELSVSLLRSHPHTYARTAFEAWTRFWKAPLAPSFLEIEAASPALRTALQAIWAPERYVIVGVKALFLLLAAVTLARLLLPTRTPDVLDVAVVTTVLGASVLQALTEYGENARYSIPFQSLIFLALVVAFSAPRGASSRIRAIERQKAA